MPSVIIIVIGYNARDFHTEPNPDSNPDSDPDSDPCPDPNSNPSPNEFVRKKSKSKPTPNPRCGGISTLILKPFFLLELFNIMQVPTSIFDKSYLKPCNCVAVGHFND